MQSRFVFLFSIVLFLAACKGRFYRAGSNSMDGTIPAGSKFFVTPTSSFNRNDVVVFKHWGNDYSSPIPGELEKFNKHWEKRVYRLIAFSGDSVQLIDADVLVNGKMQKWPDLAIMDYEVCAKGITEEFTESESDPYTFTAERKGDTFIYNVHLMYQRAKDFEKRKPFFISVKRKITEPSIRDTMLARPFYSAAWTVDNYGPLMIPAVGDTIEVNNENYKLFQNIPDIQMGKMILKEKLYFVMGDNRHGSEDSRYIGFIPHSKMIGIVK
ncbi:MAG TPA: S26 family signal peptidase [Chitinophagaceae bacterium]